MKGIAEVSVRVPKRSAGSFWVAGALIFLRPDRASRL